MEPSMLFDRLLRAEDESEVDQILRRAGYGLDNEQAWRPLGDMENNFSTVGNQQTEATAALVEKLINGIDAVLMAQCFKAGLNPEDPDKAPRTMIGAVERFFSVKDGLLANLDSGSRTRLAQNIHMVAVGDKSSPCYLIIDRGEGQTPDAFPETFLSLNRSNKLRIPFVQGKFNSGGTGVLQFCGRQNMQLIVSRRDPEAPTDAGDTSRALWGFTIVRRMRPSDGRKNSMYVYLAPGGAVPRFSADTIPVLPEDRRSIAPRPYAVGLKYGTCVKLYQFRWKAKSIATTDARYELERFLHSPCLPFRLTEAREYKANYYSTTVSGVWATIGAGDETDDKIEPGFPAYADLNLPEIGPLPYRIAVFQSAVNTRHVPHGIFFTVNGQVHGSLPSDFISRQLRFDYLKDHLLVSVDCTGMDPTVREDFFMASRDRVRKNEAYDEVVDHLKSELRDHSGLKLLNAARRKQEIEETLNDETETKNLFSELLKADPLLANLFGIGDRLTTKSGPAPGPDTPFVGKQFPTYFRLSKNPGSGLVKHCPVNLTCRVEFETDAVNDYFRRPDSAGSLTITPANIIEHANLWNGRFNAQVRVPWDANPGDRIEVAVSVEDVQTEARAAPFVSKFTLIADPEAAPRKSGGESGDTSKTRPAGGNGDGPGTGSGLAMPEVKEKHFHEPRTSLQVRHDHKGELEYFLNLDNGFLVNELTRTKDEGERALVKFWFKYGLLLCALGMVKEQNIRAEEQQAQSDRDAEDESEADDLSQLSMYCDGLARVIIPVIRRLYRGPHALTG
jgi:hypothetical protein